MSNIYRHMYLFPFCDVRDGDRVIVYTKRGEYGAKEFDREDGTKGTNHFLYRGLNETVWNKDCDRGCIVPLGTPRNFYVTPNPIRVTL